MARSIFLSILLLIVCNVPIGAQEMTEKEISELMNNAIALQKAGNNKEALEAFLTIGENTQKQRTKNERKEYVRSQTKAVECYSALEQYEEAYRLCKSLLDGNTTKEEKKELYSMYAQNGYNTATNYIIQKKRYAEAREILENILPFADEKKTHLNISEGIAYTWYFEGVDFLKAQKYNQALDYTEKAYNGFHECGATKNEISALSNIGWTKYQLYDFKGAVEAFEQAVKIASSINESTELISNLSKLRQLYEIIGDSEGVLKTEAKMDSLISTTYDNNLRFKYYNSQGDRAMVFGNYDLAEQWYNKNYEYIKNLGKDYIGADKHIYFSKMRNLYSNSKKYDDALKYAFLTKTEYEKILDKSSKHFRYSSYLLIAGIYGSKGDSTKCFQYLDTLFTYIDKIDEPREKQYLYIARGHCYLNFKNYKQALINYKTADSILSTKYSEDDGDRVLLLSMMGGMEGHLGNHKEAEQLYRKYAEGTRKLQGENSLDYIEALGSLAKAETSAGHTEAARKDYTNATNKLKDAIQLKLPYLSSDEREGFWSQVSELIQKMTPFALNSKEYQTPFTQSCYDGLVLSKAFLLGTERSTYDLIKSKGTDEDLRDYLLIASIHSKITGWEKNRNLYADSILDLTLKSKQLEKQLAERCRSYGDITSFMSIDYEKIKESLNDNEVLIDFADFNHELKGRVYAAYLIEKKQDYPLLQELFPESTIDSMHVEHPEDYYRSQYSERMLKLLWEPFKNHVKEGATVYYVPSQLLFQFALESLPAQDGKTLGDHYNFVRLSSARELVNLNPNLNVNTSPGRLADAVLYGGLQYDLNEKEMQDEASIYDALPLFAVRGNVNNGNSEFKDLRETKKEVEAIEYILKSHQLTDSLYTGIHGNTESFLNLSGKAPSILHIATHGFYFTPDSAQKIDYLKGYNDAMLLSGLVMSGGNAAWRGQELPKGVLGGILSASNISRLDLSNVDLVVLSACHSGRGETTEEGLYGLQRAFKKSGVKTMIMSLWEVDDYVGKEFMVLFYENLLDKDNLGNKRAAFNKTKSAIRAKYPDPFYWAGFIMLD